MWEQLRVQRENVRNLGLREDPSKLSCLYVIDWTFEGFLNKYSLQVKFFQPIMANYIFGQP